MKLLVASAVLHAITIWPAAFAAAVACQSPVVAPAPTTPGADHPASPAARFENRIVWVPEPQPGPAHCVHTTSAFPEGSIEANGWHASPGRLLESPVGNVVQALPAVCWAARITLLPAIVSAHASMPRPPLLIATDGRNATGLPAPESGVGADHVGAATAGTARASESPQASTTVRMTPST